MDTLKNYLTARGVTLSDVEVERMILFEKF